MKHEHQIIINRWIPISTKELRCYYRRWIEGKRDPLSILPQKRGPKPATMDRIKARYPLNPSQKKIIKRYEKKIPGELVHIDVKRFKDSIPFKIVLSSCP